MNNEIPHVIDVCALENWRLRVHFKLQGWRELDMQPYLTFGVFQSLQDVAIFKYVKDAFGTLEWPGGIDLDPEWLLEHATKLGLVAETVMPYDAH